MTQSIRLRGQSVEITEAKRARMQEELPEILWIRDAELRLRVTDAWVAALETSSFSSLDEMRGSGNYDTPELRRGTQATHIRSVTRMAVAIADEMAELFPDFSCNRDILVAGCLCHDIGKVWEFDPENIARWRDNPRATGMPSIRHPGYGVHICLTMGLPEEVEPAGRPRLGCRLHAGLLRLRPRPGAAVPGAAGRGRAQTRARRAA